MALSSIGHATLLYVLLSFALIGHAPVYCVFSWILHSCVVLRYCNLFSWTLHSCVMLLYLLLNFALMRHATARYVLLNFVLMCHAIRYCMLSWTFHSCVMLRYCYMFSWTLHSWVMLCTPPWRNMCSCGAGVQAYRVQILKSSWKNRRRCSDQKNELVSGWPENPKHVVWCRRNNCFRSTACEKGIDDLRNEITQIFIGTSTLEMKSHKFLLAWAHQTWSTNIPLIKKNHGHLKAVRLVWQRMLLVQSGGANT